MEHVQKARSTWSQRLRQFHKSEQCLTKSQGTGQSHAVTSKLNELQKGSPLKDNRISQSLYLSIQDQTNLNPIPTSYFPSTIDLPPQNYDELNNLRRCFSLAENSQNKLIDKTQPLMNHSSSYFGSNLSQNLSRLTINDLNPNIGSPLISNNELKWISQQELFESPSCISPTVSPLPIVLRFQNHHEGRIGSNGQFLTNKSMNQFQTMENIHPAQQQHHHQSISNLNRKRNLEIRDSGFVDGSQSNHNHGGSKIVCPTNSFGWTDVPNKPIQSNLFSSFCPINSLDMNSILEN